MADVMWFRLMGWNMKSPTLTGWWPGWTIRRARQIKMIVEHKPQILLAVEVGSPVHALWYERALKAKGWPMKIVRNGGKVNGKWRYIFIRTDVVGRVKASGLYTLPTKWNGDTKEVAWAIPQIKGVDAAVFCAHIENKGTESNRLKQARDLMNFIDKTIDKYDIPWSRTFLYIDTNSHYAVQNYLEGTNLSHLKIGAKTVKGTQWKSQNDWKPRVGQSRKVEHHDLSMDWLGAGGRRNASVFVQPDCHTMSDHDALIANVLKIN